MAQRLAQLPQPYRISDDCRQCDFFTFNPHYGIFAACISLIIVGIADVTSPVMFGHTKRKVELSEMF